MMSVAPAVLFGLVVWLQLHNRNLSLLNGVLVFLFAVFFVQTGIGHAVSDWVGSVLGAHHGDSGPVTPPSPPAPPAGTSGPIRPA